MAITFKNWTGQVSISNTITMFTVGASKVIKVFSINVENIVSDTTIIEVIVNTGSDYQVFRGSVAEFRLVVKSPTPLFLTATHSLKVKSVSGSGNCTVVISGVEEDV